MRLTTEQAGDPEMRTADLTDRIAYELERSILTGAVRPGAHLGQRDICDRFLVSRTPVREALRKMQALGLVDLVPNRGATVRALTQQDIEEVFDLRAELEGYAAELATRNADAGFDADLDAALGKIDLAVQTHGPDQAFNAAHNTNVATRIRDFHGMILERAGNRHLARTVHGLEAMYQGDFCSHMLARPEAQKVLYIDEHLAIRDAIVDRSERSARDLMRAHVLHAKQNFLTHFRDHLHGINPGQDKVPLPSAPIY